MNIKKIAFFDKKVIANFIFRIMAMGLNYISLPLILSFLGKEAYGIWLTFFSIINWINNFDIGIGNGLKNKLTESLSSKNAEKGRAYISTAYVIIFLISIGLFFIGILAINTFDLNNLFNVNNVKIGNLKIFVINLFILTLINFVVSLYKQIYISVHKSYIVALSIFLYQLLIILGIYLLKSFFSGSLLFLSVIYGGLNLCLGLCFSYIFFKNRKNLRPSFKYFRFDLVKDIMGVSLEFFIIQLCMIILFTTDNILISKFLNVSEVTPYNIVLKIFQVFIYSFSILMIPFWPLYTRYYVEKNSNRILRMLRNFNVLFLFISIIIMMVIWKIDLIINIWIGYVIGYPKQLPLFCGLFAIVRIYVDIYAIFVNGVGKLKFQLLGMIIGSILNIPLSIYFIRKEMGSSGVILATLISMLVVGILTIGHSIFIIKNLKEEDKKIGINKKDNV